MADDPPTTPEAPPAKPSTQDRLNDIANRWLEDRFGLKVGDGGLHLPDSESIKDFGTRAEQFVRSFFKGFLDKTPDELTGLQASDLPSAAELATRLIAKTTGTVSNAFNDYLRENAVESPDKPVVIDGRFLMRHGAPLLGRMIQAIGGAFAEDVKAEHIPEPHPKVDVQVEVPQVFKSLLAKLPTGPSDDVPTPHDPEDPT